MYDAIVVGASINGAAIARDLSLRGISTLLVDAGDIGGGTTQRSTRLVHGGLRYLEQGDFRLVRDCLRERSVLLEIAPHLVRELDFMIPLYEGRSRSNWYVRAGLTMYDLLSIGGGLRWHTSMREREARMTEPGLNEDGLRGACAYVDCQVAFPERLALEHAIDAREHGAEIRTYTRAIGLRVSAGKVTGIRARDTITGERFEARAKTVVNATGPWADLLPGTRKIQPRLRGTKGSHIVLPQWSGAPEHAVYAETVDRRPVFVVPWCGQMLVGTTDTPWSGDPSCAAPTESEARYLLDAVRSVFSDAPEGIESIVHSYAGVRPLIAKDSADPAGIPRGHEVRDHGLDGLDGFVSVYGGKITTARQVGEEVGDLIAKAIGVETRSETIETPLPGAVDYSPRPSEASFMWIEDDQAQYLNDMFGSRSSRVLDLARQDRDLATPITPGQPDILAQIVYCTREEHVRTVADFLLRRTAIGSRPGQGLQCVEMVAKAIGKELGWSASHISTEIERYRTEIAKHHTLRKEDEKEKADGLTRP